MENKNLNILMIEDNPADAELTMENLDSCKILQKTDVVQDGVEALAYLRKEGHYAEKPTPDLVLLDLNLPRKSGMEVLEEMKKDPRLKLIPVVILTSSKAEEDIVRSYDLQSSAYVTKPVDLEGFSQIVKAIENFWFSVVKFPQKD